MRERGSCRGWWVVALWCGLACASACRDITVCELPDEDNQCSADSDCLLVFCGVSCCPCERVASRRQFEGTYCMVIVDKGFDAARRQCTEAREKTCDGVVCTGVQACPHPLGARCEGGRCVAAY